MAQSDVTDEVISAEEASNSFASILELVEAGRRFVVTSNGEPVARIVPANERVKHRDAEHEAFIARLRSLPIIHVEKWTRDELYDE